MSQHNVDVSRAGEQHPPRHCRVSHLTFSLLLARMLRGPVTAGDIVDATGLNTSTAYELLRTMERHGAVRKKASKAPDRAGRLAITQFELGAAA
jgi:DNA-binding MarR family transcriptional regulator